MLLRASSSSSCRGRGTAIIAQLIVLFLLLLLLACCSTASVGSDVSGDDDKEDNAATDDHNDGDGGGVVNEKTVGPSSSSLSNPLSSSYDDYSHKYPYYYEYDILILICTQSFTGEEFVEDILLERFIELQQQQEEDQELWKIKVALVDEAGIDWSTIDNEQQQQQQQSEEEEVDGEERRQGDDDDEGGGINNNNLNNNNAARVVLIVASTYGDGEPPNHAIEFADWLSRRPTRTRSRPTSKSHSPPYFAVFGLGDSSYGPNKYCAFGKYVDKKLGGPAAGYDDGGGGHHEEDGSDSDINNKGWKRLLEFQHGDSNLGDDAQLLSFRQWSDQIAEAVVETVLPKGKTRRRRAEKEEQDIDASSSSSSSCFDNDDDETTTTTTSRSSSSIISNTGTDYRRSAIQPGSFVGQLTNKQELLSLLLSESQQQQSQSQSSVVHVTIDVPLELIPFNNLQPGDYVGIYPRNDHAVVVQALQWLSINDDNYETMVTKISVKEGIHWLDREISAYELLSQHVDLMGKPTKSTLRAMLPFVGTLELRALAKDLTFVDTTDSSSNNNNNCSATYNSDGSSSSSSQQQQEEDQHQYRQHNQHRLRQPSSSSLSFDEWMLARQVEQLSSLGRHFTKLDMAMLFEVRPSLQALARIIGPIQPRLYSISTVEKVDTKSSSDNEGEGEGGENKIRTTTSIGLCISVVEGGLCTNYISSLEVGTSAPSSNNLTMFVRRSKFHYNNDDDNDDVDDSSLSSSPPPPMLLISAGSGLGPYIGFMEEAMRNRRQNAGNHHHHHHPLSHIRLLFGCRTSDQILYKERLAKYVSLGLQTSYAFSRLFGQPKIYVQDLIIHPTTTSHHQKGQDNDNEDIKDNLAITIWNDYMEFDLDEKYHQSNGNNGGGGGRIYICGRLEMCNDVKQALVDVGQIIGGLSEEKAIEVVENMEAEKRLLTDCWSVNDDSSLSGERYKQEDKRNEQQHTPPFIGATASLQQQNDNNKHQDHLPSSSSTAFEEEEEEKIPTWPSYLRLVESGELERRVHNATKMFESCVSCGRFCEVDRLSSDKDDWGECRVGQKAIVSAVDAHFGEENCLKGVNGSGTIFFGACNLKCMYCQNWELSMMDRGEVVDEYRLATFMLSLQDRGCHNINFVSPTHNVLIIMRATLIAAKGGLKLPIVWNSGGYDTVASLRLLEGVIDIYMPDAKYASRKVARKLSKIDNYPEINQAAIKEMHRQVGELQINPRTGLAWRGVLVRHLVLPNDYAGTHDVASFLSNEVSPNTYTHVMPYFRPEFKAATDTKFGLNRKPSQIELDDAQQEAKCACLNRIIGRGGEDNKQEEGGCGRCGGEETTSSE